MTNDEWPDAHGRTGDRRQNCEQIYRSVRTLDHLADPRLDLTSSGRGVSMGNMRHESFGLMIRHEIDGVRSPKPPPVNRAAQTARMLARQIHERVEFRATVLQKLPRTFVAREQVLAELPVILLPQRAFARHDPRNFAHDMTGTLDREP